MRRKRYGKHFHWFVFLCIESHVNCSLFLRAASNAWLQERPRCTVAGLQFGFVLTKQLGCTSTSSVTALPTFSSLLWQLSTPGVGTPGTQSSSIAKTGSIAMTSSMRSPWKPCCCCCCCCCTSACCCCLLLFVCVCCCCCCSGFDEMKRVVTFQMVTFSAQLVARLLHEPLPIANYNCVWMIWCRSTSILNQLFSRTKPRFPSQFRREILD